MNSPRGPESRSVTVYFRNHPDQSVEAITVEAPSPEDAVMEARAIGLDRFAYPDAWGVTAVVEND